MRLLHFSDVHIGVENYGRPDPSTGLSTRLLDFLHTFDEVIDYAIESRVDLVVFCGDAYKSRDPNQTHQREFAKRIARLATAGVPTFLVVGNHDMPHIVSRATSLEIFRTLDVPNIHTGESLGTYVVPTASGPLQIVALPWIRRSAFLTREDTQGLSPEQVNTAVEQSLTNAIRAKVEALDPSIPAIFAGHVSMSEATTGSEQSMMLGRDHVLLKSAVALPNIDYVALGHIHRHQILNTDPMVVYSGSLQRVDFGEEKDPKGFCLIELDPKRAAGNRLVDFQFKPVDARRFLTISIDIPIGAEDPMGTVLKERQKQDVTGAIVRVLIKTPAELEGHIKDAEIRSALSAAHFIAAISKESRDQARTRLGHGTQQAIDPREALKLYLQSRNVAEDRTRVLAEHAERLMGDSELGE